jgi:hypothetical protein
VKTGTRFILEFPAVPGILGALVLAGLSWPWWALHGTAKWVWGPLWTLLEIGIIALVIASRRHVRP